MSANATASNTTVSNLTASNSTIARLYDNPKSPVTVSVMGEKISI
jgi:hypothetical protein